MVASGHIAAEASSPGVPCPGVPCPEVASSRTAAAAAEASSLVGHRIAAVASDPVVLRTAAEVVASGAAIP